MHSSLKRFGVLSFIGVVASGPLGAADAVKGKVIFDTKCAMCHAKDLKGNPAMAKMFKLENAELNLLKKETRDKKDADLIAITTKGKNKMPAQEAKLSPEDIANAVAYIRSSASGQ
jgi:mono/diheme cytochrome c family protein